MNVFQSARSPLGVEDVENGRGFSGGRFLPVGPSSECGVESIGLAQSSSSGLRLCKRRARLNAKGVWMRPLTEIALPKPEEEGM